MASNKSFTILADRVDSEVGFDGLAMVQNIASIDSGILLAVDSIRVDFPSPFGSDLTNILGNQGQISIDRITAYSGGSEIAAGKYDTSSADLASQIKLMAFPDSVTLSGGKIRQFGDAFSFGITQSISFQAQFRAPGVCDVSESGRNIEGHNIMHKPAVSALEAIVLREGEGIACIKRAFGLAQAHHWAVTVRVASTGKTYRYMIGNVGSPCCVDDPIWCLYNGSGSGLVLEVWVVNFADMGESNIPRYRIVRTSSVLEYGDGGVEILPIKHDTAADLSMVKAYKGSFRAGALAGTQGVPITYLDYQGVPMTVAFQQRIDTFRHFLHTNPQMRLTAAPVLCFENGAERWPGDRRGVAAIMDEIVLHPGEGLAVVGGGNGLIETSEAAYANIEMVCRVYSGITASAVPVVGNSGRVRVA